MMAEETRLGSNLFDAKPLIILMPPIFGNGFRSNFVFFERAYIALRPKEMDALGLGQRKNHSKALIEGRTSLPWIAFGAAFSPYSV